MSHINTLEADITKRGEYLKSVIDSQTNSLLKELAIIRDEKLKEIEVAKNEMEREIALMECFRKYCEELRHKANACDVARIADDLHTKAMELQQSVIIQNELIFIIFKFTPTDLQHIFKPDECNFVGNLAYSEIL